MRFSQFTNQRKVDVSNFSVKKNVKQKYKIIFGIDFLIKNKYDFLLSTGMIKWQDIQIVINGFTLPRQRNEYQNNGKQLHDNTYMNHTGDSVAGRKNAKYLSKDEKISWVF